MDFFHLYPSFWELISGVCKRRAWDSWFKPGFSNTLLYTLFTSFKFCLTARKTCKMKDMNCLRSMDWLLLMFLHKKIVNFVISVSIVDLRPLGFLWPTTVCKNQWCVLIVLLLFSIRIAMWLAMVGSWQGCPGLGGEWPWSLIHIWRRCSQQVPQSTWSWPHLPGTPGKASMQGSSNVYFTRAVLFWRMEIL
jgi:hypothetical protein